MKIVVDGLSGFDAKGWESHKKKDEIGVAEMGGIAYALAMFNSSSSSSSFALSMSTSMPTSMPMHNNNNNTTGFRTLRMAGSEWYVEFNIVDGVSEITDAHHTDGPYSLDMTMERLNERLAEQLADEAQESIEDEAFMLEQSDAAQAWQAEDKMLDHAFEARFEM